MSQLKPQPTSMSPGNCLNDRKLPCQWSDTSMTETFVLCYFCQWSDTSLIETFYFSSFTNDLTHPWLEHFCSSNLWRIWHFHNWNIFRHVNFANDMTHPMSSMTQMFWSLKFCQWVEIFMIETFLPLQAQITHQQCDWLVARMKQKVESKLLTVGDGVLFVTTLGTIM